VPVAFTSNRRTSLLLPPTSKRYDGPPGAFIGAVGGEISIGGGDDGISTGGGVAGISGGACGTSGGGGTTGGAGGMTGGTGGGGRGTSGGAGGLTGGGGSGTSGGTAGGLTDGGTGGISGGVAGYRERLEYRRMQPRCQWFRAGRTCPSACRRRRESRKNCAAKSPRPSTTLAAFPRASLPRRSRVCRKRCHRLPTPRRPWKAHTLLVLRAGTKTDQVPPVEV